MKKLLFLASSLSFTGDIIKQYTTLENQTIGCIYNAAMEWGGKDTRWNILDTEFFHQEGANTIDIDITQDNLEEKFRECDSIFVGGGDTLYVADLARKYNLKKHIDKMFQEGGAYFGTSAGSMLACRETYYPHPGRDTSGLGYFDSIIIPHRGAEHSYQELKDHFDDMYYHRSIYTLLTDRDMVVIQDNTQSIHTTQAFTYEQIENICHQAEKTRVK